MSELKYAYQKLMAEHNLKESDLSEDAKVGALEIRKIDNAIQLADRNGRKIQKPTFAKLKAMDKWVVNEILDMVNDTDKNTDEIPHDAEEVVEEIKESEVNPIEETPKEEVMEIETNPKGLQIDVDLKAAFESGKTTITLEELKGISKTAYDIIFETYDANDDNGVDTTNFLLVETEEEIFTLTKK